MDGLPAGLNNVFRVAVENITPLWPQIELLLEKPLSWAPTHEAHDVWKILMAQQSQLWAQMNGPVLEAFIITEFAVFPRGVWLHAWIASAREDARLDYWRLMEAMKAFARANNCRGVSGSGRIGWLRKYPEAKFEGVLARITF
jgi:hypothetical protein